MIDMELNLLFSAEQGDLVEVSRCLAEGVSCEVRDDDGYTPLLLAIGEGHIDVVRKLIELSIVESAKCILSFLNSPTTRSLPHEGLPVSMRMTSCSVSGLILGLPTRFSCT